MPTFAERLADSGPGSPLLIGVIHLPPLPGSPRWPPLTGDHFDRVIARAWEDAEAYVQGGADAVIVENFGDAPFTPGAVAPETVAAMAVAGQAVRTVLAGRLALGFNVLRNDAAPPWRYARSAAGSFSGATSSPAQPGPTRDSSRETPTTCCANAGRSVPAR